VPGRRPLVRSPEEEAKGDESLAVAGWKLQRDVERLAGCHAQRGQATTLAPLAVDGQLPLGAIAVERCEVMAVVNPEVAAPARLDVDRLCEELQLVQGRMRRAVGPDDPVCTEVRIVRRVIEVAAVRPVLPAAPVALQDAVVDPLPDEPTL
jgi:hypothetical protein